MIKINLLGDKTVIDRSGRIIAFFAGVSIVVTLFICFSLQTWSANTVSDLESQEQSLRSELAQLKKQTEEVNELEEKKADLATKLTVMAQLKRAKPGPVRILDDINNAIPERAWLTDASEQANVMTINGLALDNETVSAFMESLADSNYFDNIVLKEAKGMKVEGVDIKQFSLTSSVNYSGILVEAISAEDKKQLQATGQSVGGGTN